MKNVETVVTFWWKTACPKCCIHILRRICHFGRLAVVVAGLSFPACVPHWAAPTAQEKKAQQHYNSTSFILNPFKMY